MIRRVAVFAVVVGSLVVSHPRVRAHAMPVRGQAPPTTAPLEFDVVSIKRNTTGDGFMSARTLPGGGGDMIVNGPLPIGNASPVPGVLFANILGLPDWMRTERYDITTKPPAGATRDEIGEMWRTLFAKRMKLEAHVEEREAKVFSLVMARSDGRPGPELKKSALDCTPGRATPPPAPPRPPQGPADMLTRCGMMSTGTSMVTGGMNMDMLARNITPRAGGPVTNRTGLDGFYAFTLKYAPPPRSGANPGDAAAVPGDDPEFFAALQDQLGLKIVSEKGAVPYFIIDHIERPTDN